MSDKETKDKILQAALAQIQKKHGKESIMTLEAEPGPRPHIKTGSIGLDVALGIGGFPIGRIIEIYGPESSGKTTLALQAIRESQLMGGTCAFVDAEHALDPKYAQSLGVNIGELLVSQPDNGEEAIDIVETLVNSAQINVIIVDSVAALTPKAEIDGDVTDQNMGLHARLMSKALRRLAPIAKKTNTTIIFINQIRMKIGVMFGSPETTTGGNALKFYASVRLDIRRTGAVKVGEDIIGNETRVKVIKNKVAPPFKQAEFQILYNEGVSQAGEVLALAADADLIQKAGAWYSYNGEKIGQGQANAKKFLLENPKLLNELNNKIRLSLLGEKIVDLENEDMKELIKLNEKENAAEEAAKAKAKASEKKDQ